MRGDGGSVQDAGRGFHHRPDRHVGVQRGDPVDVARARDLGQEHAVGRHCGHSRGIVRAPDGIQPVDPHDPDARPVAAQGQFVHQRAAGSVLFHRRHGVLEVEQDGVHRQRPRLVQRARPRRGDVEGRAIGAVGHGRPPVGYCADIRGIGVGHQPPRVSRSAATAPPAATAPRRTYR